MGKRMGTEAAMWKVTRSQQRQSGSYWVPASLALLSGSLECHPLVSEPGVGY